MTVHKKLERLTAMHKRNRVSKAAGLGETTLHAIIARRSAATMATVAVLAKVLNVDAGWLGDDEKNWPPTPAKSPVYPSVPEAG